MSRTHFDGPLASGPNQAGTPGGANVGLAVLCQTVAAVPGPAGVTNFTVNLPKGSQILSLYADVATAFTNATSAALTAGAAQGGTEFLTSVDLKVAGRAAVAPTAAQIAAYANVVAPIYVTQTLVGAGGAGAATLNVVYVQKD